MISLWDDDEEDEEVEEVEDEEEEEDVDSWSLSIIDIVKFVNLKIEGIECIFITISMLHVKIKVFTRFAFRIEREPDLKELHVNTRISQRIAREPDLKELHVNML